MLKSFRIRKRALVLAALTSVFALVVLAILPIVAGRTDRPVFTRQAAEKAVQDARAAHAGQWSPEMLRDAENTLRSGLLEYRRQEVRFISLRDFEEARLWLGLAREKAERTKEDAVRAELEARNATDEALGLAERALDEAEGLTSSIRLDRPARRHLQVARASFTQARVHYEAGDVQLAQELAAQAKQHAEESCRGALRLASRFVDAQHVGQWRQWAEETVIWSRRTGGSAIVVYKEKKLLCLYVGGRLSRSYSADMGKNSLYNKLWAGDNATPEGRYHIVNKKGRGASKYYKALLLSYPNEEDHRRLEHARRSGEVGRGARPGGLIEIHGEGGRGEDWTNGCVALANHDLDDVFGRVSVGTPVTIIGGDGANGVYSDMVRTLTAPGASAGL